MPTPPKADPTKHCETCGTEMTRKRFTSGRLEDRSVFLRRKFCSLSCANTKTVVTRSGHARRAERHKKPACEECGTTEGRIHVHHKDRNWRNDDPANLQTLCASCHLKLHWREDREARMEAARKAQQTAVSRGVSTRTRSADGRWSSVGQPLLQPN